MTHSLTHSLTEGGGGADRVADSEGAAHDAAEGVKGHAVRLVVQLHLYI